VGIANGIGDRHRADANNDRADHGGKRINHGRNI
jgi:hypothetical protein